jgi:hypothetical protein
MDEAEEQLPE